MTTPLSDVEFEALIYGNGGDDVEGADPTEFALTASRGLAEPCREARLARHRIAELEREVVRLRAALTEVAHRTRLFASDTERGVFVVATAALAPQAGTA